MSNDFIKADFVKSAVFPDQYPEATFPEIAFAGRSNVGKSSMINALLGRKKLVKVGNTPGKTRLINFFNIDDRITFVDLPGYGYAKVSKKEREVWGKMMEAYLRGRQNIAACVLILDIRRLPNEDDLMMLNWLRHYGVNPLIVLTKIDKLSGNQIPKQVKGICEKLEMKQEEILQFSSVTGRGKEQVWNALNEAATRI